MPQIEPGKWKIGLPFYWVRKHRDGRVEFEFDPVDGHPTPWGKPVDIEEVCWEPMTPDMAAKIRPYQEFGIPVSAPAISIKVRDGDVPIIYRDNEIVNGVQVTCKSCKSVFKARSPPKLCPKCEADAEWGALQWVPLTWEESVYGIGVEGRFECRIVPSRIRIE